MIADISPKFQSNLLSKKIGYQQKKIDNNKAHELYNSMGGTLSEMYENMCLVRELNDRVKLPFIEFVISLPEEEKISDEKFIEIGIEYMEKMGYKDSCYTIIKNSDKKNEHIHILATNMDWNGKSIPDSKSKERSYTISRNLEKKHGLIQMEHKGFSKKTLGESQQRMYYFDNAIKKSLRNNKTKELINSLLSQSEMYNQVKDKQNSFTNEQYEIMLGSELYERVGEELNKNKYFNSLLKDELLQAMDRIFHTVTNTAEFRDKLQEEGYYMRLVSNSGKSYYVYGISEQSFYLKDTSLPVKYRYGNMMFNGSKMSVDEQKHYLYNQLFSILNTSSDYEKFKVNLKNNNINLIEHVNKTGIYGLSFSINNVESPSIFKSSEISRRLSYKSINSFFENEDYKSIGTVINVLENNKEWEKEIHYMNPAVIGSIEIGGGHKSKDDEDDFIKKKKKKGKDRGISI